MTYDMTACGNRIKALRRKNGWTQVEFAEMLEMSHSNLRKLENGYQGITIESLMAMRKLFQVPIDYIIVPLFFMSEHGGWSSARNLKHTLARSCQSDLFQNETTNWCAPKRGNTIETSLFLC